VTGLARKTELNHHTKNYS